MKKPSRSELALGVVRKLNRDREDILEKRNIQYSSDNNFVANFFDVSIIAKSLGIAIEPDEVALVLAILKLVRNANAKESGDTIAKRRDHLVDFHNYVDLSVLCELEIEQTGKSNDLEYIPEGIPGEMPEPFKP